MGFYTDFIEESKRSLDIFESNHAQGICSCGPERSRMPPVLEKSEQDFGRRYHALETRTMWLFSTVAASMRRAKIVRFGGGQAEVFMDLPHDPEQNFLEWLRLPFPAVYLHLDPAFHFEKYQGEIDGPHNVAARYPEYKSTSPLAHRPLVKGVLLVEPAVIGLPGYKTEDIRVVDGGKGGSSPPPLAFEFTGEFFVHAARTLQVFFLMPLPDWPRNLHIATLGVAKDGKLLQMSGGAEETRSRMLGWAIHAINFLSSPSVKLAWAAPSHALQKARQRQGKLPLPGWYEITYRKHVRDYTRDKIAPKQWEHGFRYDVRGHFKRFERGLMAGRVIWCPPHQRGLKHSLYKPKSYRLALAEQVAETPYSG